MTLKERKLRDPFWKTRPGPRIFSGRPRVRPLRVGEKRKFRIGTSYGTVWADTEADNNSLTYGREGMKCRRCFAVEGTDIFPTPGTDGSGTVFNVMWYSGIPIRGTPHPYLNASTWAAFFPSEPPAPLPAGLEFAADTIAVTPIDSQNMKVTVEYAILNGATQEPSSTNDMKPALLHVSSSVRNVQTAVDYLGRKMTAAYDPTSPAFDIYDSNGQAVTTPSSIVHTAKQVPATIFRFTRRQTTAYPPYLLQCRMNSSAWTILGHEYQMWELLCTRVENETEDGGFSYIVTYEFQAQDTLPVAGTDPIIPGWEVGMFYSIQNGYAVAHGDGAAGIKRFQAGQIPTDAPAHVFRIYDEVDFTALGLN